MKAGDNTKRRNKRRRKKKSSNSHGRQKRKCLAVTPALGDGAGEPRIQGHPLPHYKFEASLDYMRPCLNKMKGRKKKRKKKKDKNKE